MKKRTRTPELEYGKPYIMNNEKREMVARSALDETFVVQNSALHKKSQERTNLRDILFCYAFPSRPISLLCFLYSLFSTLRCHFLFSFSSMVSYWLFPDKPVLYCHLHTVSNFILRRPDSPRMSQTRAIPLAAALAKSSPAFSVRPWK